MKNSSEKIITVDPRRPQPDIIRDAAGMIRNGGVIAFPTSLLYGLAADALNPASVERIFKIKKRLPQNPILVLIHEREQLTALVKSIPSKAVRLMDQFWPGDVTFVFDAAAELPEALTAGTGKIGIRLCRHPVAKALCRAAGVPLTGTSANLSGQEGANCIEMFPHELIEQIEMVLDAGRLQGGTGSTVVDVTQDNPLILRDGTVTRRDVMNFINAG